MNSNKHGEPGENGEQVEFEVGIKDSGPWTTNKKVPSFNGMSRHEIEEKRAYKYRGKKFPLAKTAKYNFKS